MFVKSKFQLKSGKGGKSGKSRKIKILPTLPGFEPTMIDVAYSA
jgi:hypothetical protein